VGPTLKIAGLIPGPKIAGLGPNEKSPDPGQVNVKIVHTSNQN